MTELKPRFVVILVLALVAAFFCIPPKDRPLWDSARKFFSGYKIHLGLDLRGGRELVYQIPEQAQHTEHERVMSDTVQILTQRIEKSGIVSEPDIRRRGHNEIQIQLPDLTEEEGSRVTELLQRMGKLEFRLAASEIEENAEWPNFETVRQRGEGHASVIEYKRRLESQGAHHGEKKRGFRWYPDTQTENEKRFRLIVVSEADENGKLVKLPVFDGPKIATVGLVNVPELQPTFEFKPEFQHEFGVFTENYKGQQLAILYDEEVVSDPVIKDKLPGRGVIEGLTPAMAKNLKTIMQSGKLEVKPFLVAQNGVEPSLGSDSIRQGLFSVLVGLATVFLMVWVYYRYSGFLACIALAFNLVMMYAALVVTGATLTMPGIAGFILTVGMSIDANIIIFERIREEKSRGKTLDQAVRNGFDRAFLTIVDANVTTLITAAVLYAVGTGPVQGFAVTLFWGITCSMFTALFFVKTLMFASMKGGFLTDFNVMRLVENPNYAFVAKRHGFMALSAVAIVGGMFFFVERGSEVYGIDLNGGMQVQVRLQREKDTEEIREAVKSEFESTRVQALTPLVEGQGPGKGRSSEYSLTAEHLALEGEKGLLARKQSLLDRLAEVRAKMKSGEEDGIWFLRSEEDALISTLEMILVEEARAGSSGGEKGAKDEEAKEAFSSWPEFSSSQVSLAYMRAYLWRVFEAHMSPDVVTRYEVSPGEQEEYVLDVHLTEERSWADFERAIREKGYTPDDFDAEPIPGWGGLLSEENLAEANEKVAAAKGNPAAKGDVNSLHFQVRLRTKIDERDVFKHGGEDEAIYSQLAPEPKEWKTYFAKKKKALQAGDLIQQALREYEKDDERIFAEIFSNPFPTSTSVGGSVSDRQKTDAFWAVTLSWGAILIYVAFRFQWRFGVAAVLALVHDTLVTLGAIAVFGMMGWVNVEINLPVIAAVLTIIGYSINDTIILYDRIRENLEIGAIADFPRLVNDSINQTLSRTLGTSLTTIVVVIAMFVITFGSGSVLEGFSFTMIVGLIAGTYSSIFIAAPILVEWHERDRAKKTELGAAKALTGPPKPKDKDKEEPRKGEAAPPPAGALPVPAPEKAEIPPAATAAAPIPSTGVTPPPEAAEEEDEEEEGGEEEEAGAPGAAPAGKPGTQTRPAQGKGKRRKKKKKRRR